jgi:hypothetical protein
MASDMRQEWNQKKRLWVVLCGSSRDLIILPEYFSMSIYTRYETCSRPENAIPIATQSMKSTK